MAPRSKDGSTARLVALPAWSRAETGGRRLGLLHFPPGAQDEMLGHSKFRKTCHWAYLTRQKKDFSSMHS